MSLFHCSRRSLWNEGECARGACTLVSTSWFFVPTTWWTVQRQVLEIFDNHCTQGRRGRGGGRGVIQAAHSAYSSLLSSFLCPPSSSSFTCYNACLPPPEESTWINLSRKYSSYSCNNDLLPTLKSCSSDLLPLWFSWLHCASSKCSSPLTLLAHYSNSTMLK